MCVDNNYATLLYIQLQVLFIIDEAIRMFDRYVPFAGLCFCHL